MKQFSWMRQENVYTHEDAADRLSADIVVVGAGHAGTCAARRAAEHGALRELYKSLPGRCG